jgi:hypothetical protein
VPVDEASKNVVEIETKLGDALTGVGNRMIELHSAKVVKGAPLPVEYLQSTP